ncbi:MAG: FAD-dependent oxidoreductase [Janthinobacterium lividum]
MTDISCLRILHEGRVAVLVVDNPPVNALSNKLRSALLEAILSVGVDEAVDALVLTGNAGRFVAGADIREMSRPPEAPLLPDLIAAMERCGKPLVAAIDGPALGGGLEIALACDLRLGTSRSQLGLPETRLGLIPGAGGTQRLPRLVGLAEAVGMIAEARIVRGSEAHRLGLLDGNVEGDVVAAAVALAPTTPKRRLSALDVPAGDDAEAASAAALRRGRGATAIAEAIRITQAAAVLPFDAGLALEREIFLRLRASDEAAALRHLFLAERETARLPSAEGILPRCIRHAAVIGGGTMGSAIAVCLADAGLTVDLIEQNPEAAAAGRERVRELYARQQASGRLSAKEAATRLDRVTPQYEPEPIAAADLVIEAAFEDIDVKADIFRRLDRFARPGAILASNTSYLDLDAIADFTSRPQDVLGLHFFSPAHVMKLMEVVRGARTAPDVLVTGLKLAKMLGKIAVVAGTGEGFIGNRIFSHYRKHAEYLLEDGASPREIDEALETYGFAMGPFAVADLSGLDIAWAMRRRRADSRDAAERYVSIPDLLCEAGRLGRKTGRGWYSYDNDRRDDDPDVTRLIEIGRQNVGIRPKQFNGDAIRRRLLAVMANEGAKVLESGVATRSSDIDLVFVNGYGFPRRRGGPMFAADREGLSTVLAEVEAASRAGGAGSEPSELLVELVRGNRSFSEI